MKFLLITLITHLPDPVTGRAQHHRTVPRGRRQRGARRGTRLRRVRRRRTARAARSSPPRRRSCSATSPRGPARIRLFTAVTTLSLLDPVRAFEDYATLDHLSDGRLELIIGKGNGAAQAQLFHVTAEDQWDRNREGYELFRRLWREDKVTWSGRFRPPLHEAETWPRPLQQPIRVWHGSATSKDSVDLAARYGDPLFSANVTNPIEPYAELVALLPANGWAHYGHDPAEALVGAGTAGFYAARTLAGGDRRSTGRSSTARLDAVQPASASSRSSPPWRTRSSAARSWSAARSRSSTRCTATTSGSATRSCTCRPTPTG